MGKRQKWIILGVFGYFGGTKNGTWGARIKILRPLFNTNTPLKPLCRHFFDFGHFPSEIPIEAKKK